MSESEWKRRTEWIEEHDKTCPLGGLDENGLPKTGAIGGRFTYMFTPTSLGMLTSLKCACGEEVTLTDFDMW